MSGQNGIIDSPKRCCKETTDRFMHCIIVNATDELLSELNHNCVLKIHTLFNDMGDLKRFTERKIQSKPAEFAIKTTKNVETLRGVREKLSTCDSSSQIGDRVREINADTPDKTPNKIKKEAVNAITFATYLVTVFNQIHCKNLLCVMKDLAHLRVLLRIYADNAIPECGCALKRIDTGTQSNIINGEFSSETSLDVPTKACGKKQRAEFIPEEIAKVSDTLTAEARRSCDVVIEETVLYARKSVMLMTDRTEEKTFGDKESLISRVIDAEKKSNVKIDIATDTMQREIFSIRSVGISQDSSAFSDETSQMSRLDEPLDAKVPALLSAEEMKIEGDVMSVKHVEKSDPLDTVVITAITTEKKREEQEEEEESSNEVSLQLAIDKDISIIDKTTHDVTISSMITDLVEELTIQEPAYPSKDTLVESINIKYKMPLLEKTQTIEETEVKHSPTEKLIPLAQDMLSESVQIKHKMLRHRKTWTAKKTDEIETSPIGKPTQPTKDMFQESIQSTYGMPRFKKIRTIKDTEDETLPGREPTPLANGVSQKSVPSVQTTHKARYSKKNHMTKGIESCSTLTSFICSKPSKKSCDYFGRSTTGISQDCRQLKILQPGCCGRPRYCDTSRFSLQNEVARNPVLNHVCYPFPQDPCVSRCRSGYWWWGKTCNTNSHGKYGATAGNSSHTHAHCNGDTGYYWPHLNAIDNCRTGHCHWSDGRSGWNDYRHYGRS